ncbi:MAG: TRAP transporter small permease [Aquisalimonadaceae bacterium]
MRFLRLLNDNAERWLMLWLYAFVVLVIVIEVARRFLFDYSSLWGEEAARYAFVYLIWIGAAVGVKNRSHIRFDVIQVMLPPRGVTFLGAVGSVAIIIFACFAFYWSVDPVLVSLRFGSVTDGLRLPRAWFLLAVPFGFALVLFRAIEALVRDVSDCWHGRDPMIGQKLFDEG